MATETRRIIGIDPGLVNTGWGIVDFTPARLSAVAVGCVTTAAKQPLATRLGAIYDGLEAAIKQHQPEVMAIEQLFSVHKFANTAILMGHARGVSVLAGARHGLALEEFTPTMVKHTVTGFGRATKEQIQHAVKVQLRLAKKITNEHIADALAVAFCCATSRKHASKLAVKSP